MDKAVAEYEEKGQENQKNADRESRYMVVKTKGSRVKVILENGKQVIISKRQFPGFVKAYLRYNKREGGEA